MTVRHFFLAAIITPLVSACVGATEPSSNHSSPPAREHKSVLFIGNSFTFGAHSAARVYRAGTINDLNGDGIGGVPALFKILADEAGYDYEVSLETSPGKSLEWHWDNKRSVVDRSWDYVVMQEYSVLDRQNPGDPSSLTEYSGKFSNLFLNRNPSVQISLTATWGRPDLVYRGSGRWSGSSIVSMAQDLRDGYDRAKLDNSAIAKINPVGEAFNCAIEAGYADANPYDGIAFDHIDLWAYDHYHASEAGYYLETLVVFGSITGYDPRDFGPEERGADELGLSDAEAVQLQKSAWAALNNIDCRSLTKE